MERPEVLLSLLFDKSRPIIGTTRIQKLVFLVEQETKVKIADGFDFKAYLFGPASEKIYDDLNFLENLGYIEKSGQTGVMNELSIDNIENYNSDMFLSNRSSNDTLDDNDTYDNIAYREVENDQNKTVKIPIDSDDHISYRITDKGLNYLKERDLLTSEEGKAVQNITKKYSSKSLLNILQYVYSNYPDFAVQSIIKDRIF